jgi:hypothetical protein
MRSDRKARFGIIAATALMVAALGSVITATAANAAPKGTVFTAVCDNGKTYTATVIGNAHSMSSWTPGITADGTVLVPKSFGTTTEVVTGTGPEVGTYTYPGSVQGGTANNPQVLVNCTFHFEGLFTDATGSYHFVDDGSVSVIVAGKP